MIRVRRKLKFNIYPSSILRMRDLSSSDKHELQRIQKVNEKFTSEVTTLKREKEKLQGEITELQTQIIDLKDQVCSYAMIT